MAAKTISVRIAGKKGKVNIEPKAGATVADVLAEAAELLGVPVPEGNAVMVDGQQAALDAPVEGAEKVDAVPKPNLG